MLHLYSMFPVLRILNIPLHCTNALLCNHSWRSVLCSSTGRWKECREACILQQTFWCNKCLAPLVPTSHNFCPSILDRSFERLVLERPKGKGKSGTMRLLKGGGAPELKRIKLKPKQYQAFCSTTAQEKAEERTFAGTMQRTQQSRQQYVQGPRDGGL